MYVTAVYKASINAIHVHTNLAHYWRVCMLPIVIVRAGYS